MLLIIVLLLKKLYLNIIQEDEFPSVEMGAYCNIHVLNGGSLHPSTGFFQCLYPPHTRSPIKPEEVKEMPINLLLYFKMKCQIDELQPS